MAGTHTITELFYSLPDGVSPPGLMSASLRVSQSASPALSSIRVRLSIALRTTWAPKKRMGSGGKNVFGLCFMTKGVLDHSSLRSNARDAKILPPI